MVYNLKYMENKESIVEKYCEDIANHLLNFVRVYTNGVVNPNEDQDKPVVKENLKYFLDMMVDELENKNG